MSFYSRLSALREDPNTAHFGMKWTEEEDVKLMNHATSNMDMENIAKAHKRTISSVKSRIMSNALSMMETNGMTLDEISRHVHIPPEELREHKKMNDQKKQKQKQKQAHANHANHTNHAKDTGPTKSSHPSETQESDNDKYMQILIEIRDLLKVLTTRE